MEDPLQTRLPGVQPTAYVRLEALFDPDGRFEGAIVEARGVNGELVALESFPRSDQLDDRFRLLQSRTKFTEWCQRIQVNLPL